MPVDLKGAIAKQISKFETYAIEIDFGLIVVCMLQMERSRDVVVVVVVPVVVDKRATVTVLLLLLLLMLPWLTVITC